MSRTFFEIERHPVLMTTYILLIFLSPILILFILLVTTTYLHVLYSIVLYKQQVLIHGFGFARQVLFSRYIIGCCCEIIACNKKNNIQVKVLIFGHN